MGIPYRSARRVSLPALAQYEPQEAASLPQLAPDIITARERPARSRNAALGSARAVGPLQEASILEERHPEMARAITLLWGYPEMNEYFDRIWIADGFQAPINPDAMSELMLLARLHQAILPQRPDRTMASMFGSSRLHEHSVATARDPWGDVPPRR